MLDPWSTVDPGGSRCGAGGFRIAAEALGDMQLGDGIEAAGDVNGDGVDDLILGARRNDAGGANAGAAYVIFGGPDVYSVDLGDIAAGVGGFKIIGERLGDNAGASVHGLGDVNSRRLR